jgi:Uma2 family endonuclease
MVALPIAKPIHTLQLSPGSLVTISGVSWDEYEALLTEMGDRSGTRILYSYGTLELMSPLPEHEIPRDVTSDVVKLLLKRAKIPNQPFGSTTFQQLGISGVEPDACFYIQNMRRMIGKRRLSPGDPPPDLALETEVTSKTALAAYEAIGVPELWIYDSGILNLYELRNGKYIAIDRSPLFPELDVRVLLPQLIDRSWAIGSYAALEEFENTLNLG